MAAKKRKHSTLADLKASLDSLRRLVESYLPGHRRRTSTKAQSGRKTIRRRSPAPGSHKGPTRRRTRSGTKRAASH